MQTDSSNETSVHPWYGYVVLVAAVIMQMCLGATYAWSVFVAPLKELTGIGQSTAQLPFTLFYMCFPATASVAGFILARFGPRPCAIAGGLLFGSGWLLASQGSTHLAFTALGIGIVGGVGVGLVYLVPIAVSVLWFPRHKGLVMGIAVAGFGGGAALVGALSSHAMLKLGYTPFRTFGLFGAVFATIIPVAGCLLQRPAGYTPAIQQPGSIRSSICTSAFVVLYLGMTCGLMAGMTVNANLKQLATSASTTAAALVGCFAAGNAAGRILWGAFSDRMGTRFTIALNLVLQGVLLLSSSWFLDSATLLLIFAGLIGLNYGGVLVLYASAVARIWGTQKLAILYGMLFSSNIIAAVSPFIAGIAYDRLASFQLPLILIACSMFMSAALILRNNLQPVQTEELLLR